MASKPSQFLSGKKIIVAGSGIAGTTFIVAISKLWDSSLPPPQIVVFDRDHREVNMQREGYSLSLGSADTDGGLVALRDIGLLDEILACSVLELGAGRFKVWDHTWRELISVPLATKGHATLPVTAMRIRRKDLRRVLLENAEKTDADFFWGSMCTAAEKLDDGRVRVSVLDAEGSITQHECDLLIASDGARSKIRASLRPDDNLVYQGAIQMGGNARFPEGLPSQFKENYGLMISGKGVCCFFSAVDDHTLVWALSKLEPERQNVPRQFSLDDLAALKKEALELGSMFEEPFRSIVEATEAQGALYIPARDKKPFSHDENLRGVMFLGDANHAVSPFAANGANLALKDGWDLAERICQSRSMAEAVKAYDKTSLPRAYATMKNSHLRIALGHCTGIKDKLFRAFLATGQFMMWLTNKV